MSKLVVPLLILIVAYGQETIDDPEGILVIFAQLVPPDLGRPPGEILPIEEADPLLGRLLLIGSFLLTFQI